MIEKCACLGFGSFTLGCVKRLGREERPACLYVCVCVCVCVCEVCMHVLEAPLVAGECMAFGKGGEREREKDFANSCAS